MTALHALEIALVATVSAVVVALILARRHLVRERRHRELLAQLPKTTVVLIDPDLRVRVAFGAGEQIDGEPVAGKHVSELLPDSAATASLISSYRAALDGEQRAFEYRGQFTDEVYAVRTAPLRERGEVVGAIGAFENVSGQRELTHQAAQRQVILDLMNEAYVSTDAAGIVTGWNRAAETTFGWSADEAIGRPVADLIVPAEDLNEFSMMLERSWPGVPTAGRFEIRAERNGRDKDGRTFPLELAVTIAEIDGETVAHGLMHDITDRKQAERDLQENASDFAALAEAVGELARSNLASEARGAICRAVTRIAGADAAGLMEPDPSGTALETTASEGVEIVGDLVRFTETAGAVRAFGSREPYFTADVASDRSVRRAFFKSLGLVSVYWVPILQGEEALGVIMIGWKQSVEAPSARLERLMRLLAAEAAVAIERAALLDRLERMAHTDDLTGLVNRRAWDDALEREVARARRENEPLAVAMLDLDRFKEYNDRHGHQAGDRVLREAASAWRAVLRESDLLARYGGEEFTVALPGCDLQRAAELVNRLREVTPAEQSCSAGLACWDGGESADQLLGRADSALYDAKQSGRNRTVVA
ncbi:MAG TPA: diguanylate cyclase [Solirubrobacterales bacterium]|nr:diguanylate cyclase [Solirubrobacterales bacterium]